MFQVKDFMTKDVITVEKDTKISEVIDLMRFHHIHRIPVVDSDGKLVGLITEGMIAGHDNSATSLSIYELNYLLSKTDVKTIMVRNVHSVNEDSLMEAAAAEMLEFDVGCLPVVDNNNTVKGILTQNDVFKEFLNVLGWEKEGLRITLQTKDEVGTLEKICKIFADNGVNIFNVGVYSHKDGVAQMVIRCDRTNTKELTANLEKEGFEVLEEIEN